MKLFNGYAPILVWNVLSPRQQHQREALIQNASTGGVRSFGSTSKLGKNDQTGHAAGAELLSDPNPPPLELLDRII